MSLTDNKPKKVHDGKKKSKSRAAPKVASQTSYSSAPVMSAPAMSQAEYAAANQAVNKQAETTVAPTTARKVVSYCEQVGIHVGVFMSFVGLIWNQAKSCRAQVG
jgi:hypothetical protein